MLIPKPVTTHTVLSTVSQSLPFQCVIRYGSDNDKKQGIPGVDSCPQHSGLVSIPCITRGQDEPDFFK